MAANPPLVQAQGGLFPAPYSGEFIALGRDGVEVKIEGVRTSSGKWSANGTLFLTNMRLVFVAPKPDKSGLQAFELPLAYVYSEKFSQPILACNNLAGECRMVDGGAGGGPPSVKFTLYFKQGGVGTLIPLFMRFLEYIRVAQRNLAQQAQQQGGGYGGGWDPSTAGAAAAGPGPVPPGAAPVPAAPQQFLATALVDPNDPSKLYLTQPVDDSQRRPDEPKFGAPLI